MAETEYTKGYRAGYDYARAETETRIIKLLSKDYWHSQVFDFAEVICLADCEMCKTIDHIKGNQDMTITLHSIEPRPIAENAIFIKPINRDNSPWFKGEK